MKGFLLGLIVAGVGFAGYYYLKGNLRWPLQSPPAAVDAGAPPAKEAREKKKKRHHGAVRVAHNDGAGAVDSRPGAPSEPEPEPIKLSPADLKLVSQGDDLSKPDVVHLGDATDDTGSRELTQDDVDAKFRAKEDAILACISRARLRPGRICCCSSIRRRRLTTWARAPHSAARSRKSPRRASWDGSR